MKQCELKNLLDYEPDTGLFRWRHARGSMMAGKIAGCVQRTGCRHIKVNRKIYTAHRLAWLWMYGAWPEGHIDHINHNRDDNRIINLRVVSAMENAKNQSIPKNNKSGVLGVAWKSGRWVAKITVNYKRIHIGTYETFTEAVEARKDAENKYGFHENHGGL